MVPNSLESDFWSIGSSISNLLVCSWSMLIGGEYMMYNLPLKLLLEKLTDIDNKLALLVENQPIDMEKEMRIEEEKEKIEDEHQGQSQVRNKANRRRSVPKKEADKA